MNPTASAPGAEPPDGIERLIGLLAPNHPADVRRAALVELMKIGRAAGAALPAVLDLLGDADEGLRDRAAEAVAYLGPSNETLSALADRLAMAEVDVGRAARIFAKLGRRGVPALVRLLKAESPGTRFLAARALKEIAWLPAEAADTVLDSLAERPTWNSLIDESRIFAVDRRMLSFGWFDEPVPVLARALRHPVVEVRRLAAEMAARQLRTPIAELFPRLAELCADADGPVRTYALGGVIGIANTHPDRWAEALPLVRRGAADADPEVRRAVFDRIGSLRREDRGSTLQFCALNEPNPARRDEIERLMMKDELRPAAFVGPLAEKIRLGNSDEARDAADELRRYREEAAAATDAIVDRLTAETVGYTRRSLARALAAIDPFHSAVRTLFLDSDSDIRLAAIVGATDSRQPLDRLSAEIEAMTRDESPWNAKLAARVRYELTRDVGAYVDFLVRQLAQAPVYECKERELFGDPRLGWLRQAWTENVNLLVELAAAEPTATALIARAIDEQPVPAVQKGRLELELYGTAHSAFRIGNGDEFGLAFSYDFETAVATAELLWRLGSTERQAVPEVRERLRERYYVYRLHALQVLGRIGPAAESALGDVVRMLSDGGFEAPKDDESHYVAEVADEAARAIGRICPELRGFTDQFRLIAADRDVAGTLRASGRRSPEEWKSVLREAALRYGDADVGDQTVDEWEAAADAPPLATRQVESLTAFLSDERPELRRGAALALGKLRSPVKSALPRLIELLERDPSTDVRDAAVRAVAVFGASAVEPLRPLLGHADWLVRLEVAEALHRCGALSPDEQPLAYDLLHDVDGHDVDHRKRRMAPAARRRTLDQIVELLGSRLGFYVLGEPQRRLLAPLAALADESWRFRDVAMWQIGRFGRGGEHLVPVLIDALGDPEFTARQTALLALEKVSPLDARFQAALSRLLEDESESLRSQAAALLASEKCQ